MTQLIDKKAVLEAVKALPAELDAEIVQRCIEVISNQPTVDAVPVRHGKWIKLDMHAHLADHKCTACGQECYVPTCMGEPMYIYCPNCGARIDEE